MSAGFACCRVYNNWRRGTMSTTDGSEGASTAAHVPAAPPPTITTAVGLHGAVGAFDPAMEEWSEYSDLYTIL